MVTTEKDYAEAYVNIADFVNEYGLENFTVKKLKEVDSLLLSFICRKLGGLKKVKAQIIEGKLNLGKYSSPVSVSEKADEVIAKMKEGSEVYVDQELLNCMTPPELAIENINPVPLEESETITVSFDAMVELVRNLDKINSRLDVMVARQDSIEDLTLSVAKSIPTSIDRMNEKIRVLDNDMVDDVRTKIADLVLKYCHIKFGNTNADSVRKAYNDMYLTFNKKYSVNLDSIQVTTINITNHNRAREGKRAYDYIDPKVKGLRKIDIVERLGMIPELYMIVRGKLAEEIPSA